MHRSVQEFLLNTAQGQQLLSFDRATLEEKRMRFIDETTPWIFVRLAFNYLYVSSLIKIYLNVVDTMRFWEFGVERFYEQYKQWLLTN